MTGMMDVARTGLIAAQTGLTTTSHNIANATTPGYSRQLVVQGTAGGDNIGGGFQGRGTQVIQIKRAYDDFLGASILSSQTSKSAFDSYYNQISQINNMFADTTVGLSPSLQGFFNSLQDLSAHPNDAASRQSVLSSGEALVERFQGIDAQLNDLRQGVNDRLNSTINTINAYANQLSKLNDSIVKAQGNSSNIQPNDLMDQRDQVLADLSKEIKVSVVKQSTGDFNVFIGNGQPLVVGTQTFSLVATRSASDVSRVEVGYKDGNTTTVLPETSLSGGNLGGLFDFRANSLDIALNSIGRIGIAVASTFNDQHKLGVDQNGSMGGNFFAVGTPVVTANTANQGTAVLGASITNVGALTTSDYRLQYDGTNYKVTRLSDSAVLSNGAFPAAALDGVTLGIASGSMLAGDSFLIKPTVGGAAQIAMLVTDKRAIAAAAPIKTAAPSSNTGTAKISAGTVSAGYVPATLAAPVTLTYDSATNTLSGFPPALAVTVTNNGVATINAAPVASITYTSGATLSFGNMSVVLTGAPGDNDTFTLSQNTNAGGDSRNSLLLSGLQTSLTLDGGTTTYQGAFGQLINLIGNKTRELDVNNAAEDKLLTQAKTARDSVSGVNLDEEATNMLRYQQAYQAAGKVIQTASTLFDVLLSLGR